MTYPILPGMAQPEEPLPSYKDIDEPSPPSYPSDIAAEEARPVSMKYGGEGGGNPIIPNPQPENSKIGIGKIGIDLKNEIKPFKMFESTFAIHLRTNNFTR